MSAAHPLRAASLPRPLERSWWLVVALCAVIIMLLGSDRIADYDFWEHLTAGRHLWQSHQIPRTNLWTWPDLGTPDIDPSWGFQAALFPFFARGGVLGLYFWRWGAALAAFALAVAAARSLGAGRRASALAGLLAALVGRSRMLPRPETLAMVFLGLFVWLLERRRSAGKDATSWLPLVMVLWVNVHISALLGPLIVGIHAMLETIGRRRHPAAPGFGLWIVFAACVGALLVNPFGWHALEQPLRFALEGRGRLSYRMIAELQPPDLSGFWRDGLPLALVLWPLLWTWRALRGRRDGVELALLVLFTAMACSGRRFVGFYAVGLAPYLARDLTQTIAVLPYPRRWRAGARTAAAAALGLVMVAPSFADPARRPSLGIAPWAEFPGVCDYLVANDVRGRMFNHFHMGGYLLWRLWPARLPFRTGRLEISQSAKVVNMDQYMSATVVEQDWHQLLDRFHFDQAILDRAGTRDSIAAFLERDPQWALVFCDDQAALFLRRGADHDSLIARDGYRRVAVSPAGAARMGVSAGADTTFRREMRAELERATSTSPASASANSWLANLDMLDARWEDARRHLDQAHRVDPELLRYDERLGLLSLAQGRPREALGWFERQRGVAPGMEDVEARFAQAYLALGDTTRAREHIERELARHPDNRIAHALLAAIGAR